jgi:hypothetical protein
MLLLLLFFFERVVVAEKKEVLSQRKEYMIAAESWKKKIETFCRKEMNMKKRHFSPVQKKKPINSSQFSHAQRSRTTLSLSLSLSRTMK